MRIKKIEWEKNGISKYKVALPFGYNVEIIPRFDGFAGWSIYKGHELIKNDYCITISGAQLACEEAWEEIVKEALEPSSIFVATDASIVRNVCTSKDELNRFLDEYDGYPSVDEFVINLDGSVVEVEYED